MASMARPLVRNEMDAWSPEIKIHPRTALLSSNDAVHVPFLSYPPELDEDEDASDESAAAGGEYLRIRAEIEEADEGLD
uniref:Uncharacterized protein n=1 Tax=Mycena chlorophos TaxID=658473 RepID=A0ABQ0MCQ4_MYCCL|nr:predicted protein [Mycena chlorophos]